jgi:hypothetical protein
MDKQEEEADKPIPRDCQALPSSFHSPCPFSHQVSVPYAYFAPEPAATLVRVTEQKNHYADIRM